MTLTIKDTTVQPSYFQAVKEFINLRWAAARGKDVESYFDYGYYELAHFTTAELRACTGHLENQTPWKRMTGNPNYLMHIYIGELRRLGALKRFGHGKYMIVAPIPEWFGSFHFAGLQGKYVDGSCYYWNDLPAMHKRNPWANITEHNDTTTLTNTTMKKKSTTNHKETLEKVNNLTRIDQILATISSMEEELQALKSKGPKLQYDEDTYTFTEEVFLDIIRTTIALTKEEMLRLIRDGEVRIDQDAAVTLSIDSSNSIDIELEYDAIADSIDEEIEMSNVWDTVTEQLANQFDLSIDEDCISTPC